MWMVNDTAMLEHLSLDFILLTSKVIWLLESRTMAWSILVDSNWTPWYSSTKPLVHKKSIHILLEVSNFCKVSIQGCDEK